jgi:hypothetical protein
MSNFWEKDEPVQPKQPQAAKVNFWEKDEAVVIPAAPVQPVQPIAQPEPVAQAPVQPEAVEQPSVSSAFTPAAGSSSQSYPAPVAPAQAAPSEVKEKTRWTMNDGNFHKVIKPGEPIGIVFGGKKMMAVYDATTGKFKTDIDDPNKLIKGNTSGLPSWTDAFNTTAYPDTYGKLEVDPSQVQAWAEGKGALRSVRNTALRALPSTATGFAAFNAAGIPAAAYAGRIHPYLAPVGMVVGGGLAAMGAGSVTDLGVNAMFPLDEEDELNQLLYPTQNTITQHGVSLAAMRPSVGVLKGMASLESEALKFAGKGAALNTALSGQHRLVDEIMKDEPVSWGNVFSPREMLKDAAVGGLTMHKVTGLGHLFEAPGKYVGNKAIAPLGQGPYAAAPKPGEGTQSTEDLRNAEKPEGAAEAQPAGKESTAAPEPASGNNVPPRPKVPDVDTGTEAEWAEYRTASAEWDSKYEKTHFYDGTQMSQEVIDIRRQIREEREAREAAEAAQAQGQNVPPSQQAPAATEAKPDSSNETPVGGNEAGSPNRLLTPEERSARVADQRKKLDEIKNRPLPKTVEEAVAAAQEDADLWTGQSSARIREQAKNEPDHAKKLELANLAELAEARKQRALDLQKKANDDPENYGDIADAFFNEVTKIQQRAREAGNKPPVAGEQAEPAKKPFPEPKGDRAIKVYNDLMESDIIDTVRIDGKNPVISELSLNDAEMLLEKEMQKLGAFLGTNQEGSPGYASYLANARRLKRHIEKLKANNGDQQAPAEPAKTPEEPVIPEAQDKAPEVGLVRDEGFTPEEVTQLKDLGLQSMKKQLADMEASGRGDTRQAQRLRDNIAAREKGGSAPKEPTEPTEDVVEPKEDPKDVAEREALFNEENPVDVAEPSKDAVDYEDQKSRVAGLEKQLAKLDKQKPNKYTDAQRDKIKATLDKERAALEAMPVPVAGPKPKKGRAPRKVVYDDNSLRHVNSTAFSIDVKNGGSQRISLNRIKETMPHLYDKALKMYNEADAESLASFKRIDADIKRFSAEAKAIADSDMTVEQKRKALAELDAKVEAADFPSAQDKGEVYVGIDPELLTDVNNTPSQVTIRRAEARKFPVNDPANGWQEGTTEAEKLHRNIDEHPHMGTIMGIALHMREAKDAIEEGLKADALEMAKQGKGLAESLEGIARRRAKKLIDSFEEETGIKIGKSIQAEEKDFSGDPVKGVPFPDSGPETEGLVNNPKPKEKPVKPKKGSREYLQRKIDELHEEADDIEENDPDRSEELRAEASNLQEKLDAMGAEEPKKGGSRQEGPASDLRPNGKPYHIIGEGDVSKRRYLEHLVEIREWSKNFDIKENHNRRQKEMESIAKELGVDLKEEFKRVDAIAKAEKQLASIKDQDSDQAKKLKKTITDLGGKVPDFAETGADGEFTIEHKKGRELESKPHKGPQSFLGKNDAVEIKDSNGNVIGESILLGNEERSTFWGVEFRGREGSRRSGSYDPKAVTKEQAANINRDVLKQVLEREVAKAKASGKHNGTLEIRMDTDLAEVLGLSREASAADIARAFKKQFGYDMVDSYFPLSIGIEGTSGSTRAGAFVVDLGVKDVTRLHGDFSENRIDPSDDKKYVKQNTPFSELYSGKEPKAPQLRDGEQVEQNEPARDVEPALSDADSVKSKLDSIINGVKKWEKVKPDGITPDDAIRQAIKVVDFSRSLKGEELDAAKAHIDYFLNNVRSEVGDIVRRKIKGLNVPKRFERNQKSEQSDVEPAGAKPPVQEAAQEPALIRKPGAKEVMPEGSKEKELFDIRAKVIKSLKDELSATTDPAEAKRLKGKIDLYEYKQMRAERIIEVEGRIAKLEAEGKGNGPTAKKLRDNLEVKKAAWGESEIDAEDLGRISSKEGETLDMRRDPEDNDASGWAKERMDKLFKEWRERNPDAPELDFWKEARERKDSQSGSGWFEDIAWRKGDETNHWPKHEALRNLINQKLAENTRDLGLQKTWTHEDGTKIITDGNRFFAYDKDGNSIGPRDGETSFKSIVHRVVQHGDDIQFRDGSGYRAKQKQNEYDRKIDKVRDEITEARRDGNEVLTQLKLKELESLLTESKRWFEGAWEQKEARDEARSNRKSSYENEKKWTLDETLDSRRDPGEARDSAPKKLFSYPNTKKFNEWARGNQYGFKPAEKMPLLVRGIDSIRDFAKLVDGFVTTAFHGTKSEGRDFDQFKPGELTYFVADRDAAGAYAKDSPDMYYVRSKRPAVLTNPREAIKAFENGDKSDLANIGKDLIEFYEKVASKQFGDRESFISALEEGRLFDIDGKGQKGLQNEMAEWFLKKKEGLKYDSVVFKDSTVSSESPSIVVSNDGDSRLGAKPNTGIKAASNFGEFSSEDPRFDYSRRDPENDANDAFDMEERKAKELDRRVKQNSENREAGKEEDGGRRGFIGIMDRAVSEARMRGEITDKEVEGLSRIINYIGGQFFEGVKLSIRQGRPGHQGQYDVANRIVTIFKEAIQRGKFEDTAGHEVGHHLEQFLPEGDRAALRAEWAAARKKFTEKWATFGRLVGDAENWGQVKVSPEAYDAAIADMPTLSRFFTPEYTDKGKIKHYRVKATEEMYRLFTPKEWFAETFKDAVREKLESDPAYTGEQAGWKQKLVGLWNSIKTSFAQMFGKEQAKRILANFAKGRYKPEDADPSIYREGDQMFSKRDVEAETRLTPEERDAIDQEREDSRAMARGEKPELNVGGKVWRSVVDHPFVSWFKPLSMRMRTIADLNPQSETLQEVVNDFSLIPGKDAEAPDYNTDSANMRNVFYNKLTKAFGPVLEDMRKMGPAELKEFNSLFIKQVEGRAARPVGGRVGEAIKQVRSVLEEMHQYGIKAGLKLGKVEGYFPRAVDAEAVAADPKGFVRAATRAYEVQFERLKQEAKDKAAEEGTEYVEPETPDFDQMARNWRDAVLLGREGLDFEHGIFEEPRQGTKESYQKKREFTKDEALLFDHFREKDVERTIINYVGSLVRKAEVSRRIGVDNGAWGKIKSKMDKEGVDPKDIAEIEQLIKSNIGIGGKRIGESTQRALDFTKLISNAAYLKLTGLLNITEAASIGIRTNSAYDSARAVVQMLGRTGNVAGRLTPEQTTNAKNEIERIYGKGHDLASALAIEFGINTIDRGFGTVASGYHLDGGSDYHGKLNRASDGVYRMYGIHATESAKREVSLRIGADFIDTTIKWLEGTHNLQRIGRAMGKKVVAENLAKDRLKELGINESDMPEFSEWVKKMREGDEVQQLKDIMGKDTIQREKPWTNDWASKYRQALIIFNKQSSVQASRGSRTESANDTALGRLFFQFSTFTNEWSAQHGRRMAEQARKVTGDSKYNAAERMLAAGVAPAFAVATAATWGIRTIINMLTGFEFKEGETVPAWVKSVSDAFVYTGMLGPAEIIWKAISRGQLPAGVVGDWGKKAWGAANAVIENPESNAARRAAASVSYRSAAVPALNAGLALATEAAPLPGKLAAGLAAQAIANNRTEKGLADLVAGEAQPRGSSQAPEPRTPPKPKPPSR